ncbi:uncharacterized protein LOC108201600 [Daucus carota subsp. sativus]|uniref:uncharacterized protein LOC108201600 n=1 Tax=Daucus carota subsp. sativus TaxID=79200 RepID=UPI0030831A49
MAKRILQHIEGTLNYGVAYFPSKDVTLYGYGDSDWGGNVDDRKSTTGFIFFLGDTAFTCQLYFLQMVSAELNQNGDNSENLSPEQLLSTDSSDAHGLFGEPKVLPRVGDDYQAEIPAVISGPEYDSYMKKLDDAEKNDHVPLDFQQGLPVPVKWTRNINKDNMRDAKQGFSTQSNNAPSLFISVRETNGQYQGSSYSLVPEVCGDSWNEIEEASFLLGLYIFKKDFGQLERFVGTKKMGNILLYYYSKFYKSSEYNRWSTSRKGKSKKCVSGHSLFSDLRRQEILSRLLSQVSEECQKALIKATKAYEKNDEKKDTSLIDYVFSIKSVVGIETFVDVVSIGKGKRDLTNKVIAPVQIPTGEACSFLTCTEIVNFLTGGYRLTKAQSSDLFWIAVWPRLLASGWHSEQPKKQACVPGAKDNLVFLTPGVEKFSRGLLKGKHYFVSVMEVLDKVGSEPELLEPHTENDEGEKEEEDGWIEEISDSSSDEPVKKVKNLKTLYDDQQARKPVDIHLSQKQKRNDLDTSTSVRKSIYDSNNKAFTPQQPVNFPNTSADMSVPEQPAILNPRGQSTRNRAPTARALEALVNGDLTASSNRRRKD